MNINRIWGVANWIGLLPLGLAVLSTPAIAQIVPDNTLGAENSQVTSDVNVRGFPGERIDGGATRGSALFHSFSEFNVNDGQRVYFSNPAGIDNILTRVTGANVSNILGTLGVDGGANLFLLNPNGILFGPNAQLDIQGSFVASTARGFKFADGSEFNATNPQAAPLLTMSVTPGVQWGTTEPGATITNRGNLSVGQDLTLAAGSLDLQGQLQAGRDLTLQAQDTLTARDTVSSPFVATSGRHLTMQGNQSVDIFALNHPQSQLQSRGNFNLISDGNISGDAHFFSGGNLSMLTLAGTPGNFVSLFDPIIRANGDVQFGDYTGVALKVEATGNIRGGNIRITGPDNTSTIPGNDPDYATLTQKPSVILRAGLASVTTPNLPQSAGGASFTATSGLPLGITVGNIDTSRTDGGNGGDIILSAANGSITARNLDSYSYSGYGNAAQGGAISLTAANDINITGYLNSISRSDFGNAAQGGAISLTAANDIKSTGYLNSFSSTVSGDAGNGGAISLTAANGSITTGDLNSISRSFSSGSARNGGAISLTATNDIKITGYLNSFSSSSRGSAGNGGAISLSAANGSITTGDLKSDSSSSSSGSAGNGGTISLTAANDINITGYLKSDSSSSSFGSAGNGGAISLTAANGSISTSYLNSFSSSFGGNAGNGGAISLSAANGSISTGDLKSDSFSGSGNAGNGGVIGLSAANGSITTRSLDSDSFSGSGNAGNGGAISLSAANDIKITGYLQSDSFSNSRNAGNGGAISLSATNDINITGDLQSDSSSGFGNAGNGGAISLSAANDINITGDFYSDSFSFRGNAGNGGAISLSAANDVKITGNLYSYSYSKSATAGQGGTIFLSARGGDISGQGNPSTVGSFSISEQGTTRNGGNVVLEAKNNVSNLEILTLSSDSQSGTVQVTGLGDLLLTNTNILTSKQVTIPDPFQPGKFITLNVGRKGQSGNVDVISSGNLTFNNSSIQSDTKGSDPAGNVMIASPGLVTFNNSQIINNTSSTGRAGNINIDASNLTLDQKSSLDATTAGTGGAGNVSINVKDQLNLVGGQISTSVEAGANVPSSQQPSQININAGNLSITDGGSISASVNAADSTKNLPAGQGDAGNIDITVRGNTELSGENSRISNAIGVGAIGQAGSITLNTGTLTATGGASIDSSIAGTGTKVGSINLNATGAVNFSGNGTGISSELKSGGSGQGGSISLNANSLALDDQAAILATTSGQGNGGNIDINARTIKIQNNSALRADSNSSDYAPGDISLQGTELISITNQGKITSESQNNSGGSGEIHIEVNEGSVVLNQATVSANNQGLDDAGDVFIDARDRIDITNDSTISGNGNFGRILVGTNLTPQTVEIDNSKLTTINNRDTSDAGDIFINARDRISIANNSQISADGHRGRIFVGYSPSENDDELTGIPPQAIAINNSELTTTNEIIKGTQNAGNIFLRATGNTSIENNSRLSTFTVGSGLGGNIDIKTGSLLVDSSQLNGTTSSTGKAGDVSITAEDEVALKGGTISTSVEAGANVQSGQPSNIKINAGQLSITEGGAISASVNKAENNLLAGRGDAGNINISVRGDTQLSGANSRISNAIQSGAIGQAGSITLNTGTLTATGGGSIDSSVAGTSTTPGNINLNATGAIAFSGDGTGVSSEVKSGGSGQGGNISLTGSSLTVDKGAAISASTSGQGNAGNVTVGTTGDVRLQQGEISSQVNNGATGNAGAVTINAQNGKVELGQQSQISSAVQQDGKGNAGSVTINTQQLALGNGSQATVSSTGNGTAGNLTVNSPSVLLDNQAKLTATTQAGSGGDIQLQNLSSLQLSNGSEISASTQSGKGGNVSVIAPGGTVALTGNSHLEAEATQGGQAGNLQITANQLTLRDGSSATVSSPQGQAGNLSVIANTLLLDQGKMTAETGKRSDQGGANINLQLTDLLLLRNQSLISANAKDAANGGNITIKAPFVIAVPSENSDIIANAVNGDGGQINITANRIFGLKQQNGLSFDTLRNNRTSDISASSQFGLQGNINIQALSIDPSQGLSALPIDLIDPSNQITRSCGASATRQNQFVVTGRGGLPPSPDDLQTIGAFTPGWVTRESSTTNRGAASIEPPTTETTTSLVEAQGMVMNAKGELMFTAQAATTTPHQSGFSDKFCSAISTPTY